METITARCRALAKGGKLCELYAPKDPVDRLHLEPGDRVLVVETEKGILLTPTPAANTVAYKNVEDGR